LNSQRVFFNSIAEQWDTMCVHDHKKINQILDMICIKDGSQVLDVACGTGVLAPFYHARNPHGRMTCVDIAEKMIEVANKKYQYANIQFVAADILEYTPSVKLDLVMLYTCFPHFPDKKGLLQKLSAMLQPGGKICVCHSQSREEINHLHQSKEEVKEDQLPPAVDVSALMETIGLKVLSCVDNDDIYVIIGQVK
jgi:ubiquinone/menaquinone biosynthesis C-methylase UbiE